MDVKGIIVGALFIFAGTANLYYFQKYPEKLLPPFTIKIFRFLCISIIVIEGILASWDFFWPP